MFAEKLFKWFKENQVKNHKDKCRLILSKRDLKQIQTGNSLMKNSLCEKILGVKFDHNLTFDEHVKSLCKKPNSKLYSMYGIGLAKKKYQCIPFLLHNSIIAR